MSPTVRNNIKLPPQGIEFRASGFIHGEVGSPVLKTN